MLSPDPATRAEMNILKSRLDKLERAGSESTRIDRLERDLEALREATRREFDAIRRRTQA